MVAGAEQGGGALRIAVEQADRAEPVADVATSCQLLAFRAAPPAACRSGGRLVEPAAQQPGDAA